MSDIPSADPSGEPAGASAASLAGRARRALSTRPAGSDGLPDAAVDPVRQPVADPVPAAVPALVEAADADPADDAPDTPTTSVTAHPEEVRRRAGIAVPLAVVVLVAALVFAVVAGIAWRHARSGSGRSIAAARDAATVAARIGVVTVNTSDYRHPDDAVSSWLAVSTGPLHQQFAAARKTAVSLLTKAKVITRASVLAAAVSAVDPTKGTATVLESASVTRTPTSGAPVTSRNRFRATMTRVGGRWKLADLSLVEVQLQ